MAKLKNVLLMLLVFIITTTSLSAHTFMVDTRDTIELSELEGDRRLRVVATETAVMDALFDQGHIFFSMYTFLDGSNDQIQDLLPIHYSQREGVDYLIRLSPDENGVDWSLHSIKPVARVSDGRVELDDTETSAENGLLSRWTAVGELIAAQIFGNLPSR